MTGRIQLELEAQAFADATAKPPLLFTLGPEKGRLALEEAQAGQVSTLPVDIEDLTIDGGSGCQVALYTMTASARASSAARHCVHSRGRVGVWQHADARPAGARTGGHTQWSSVAFMQH